MSWYVNLGVSLGVGIAKGCRAREYYAGAQCFLYPITQGSMFLPCAGILESYRAWPTMLRSYDCVTRIFDFSISCANAALHLYSSLVACLVHILVSISEHESHSCRARVYYTGLGIFWTHSICRKIASAILGNFHACI